MSGERLTSAAIRRVMTELKELTEQPPEGIQVFPNEEDISDIGALIIGPVGTPFEGGHFRMKLKLGADFPQTPPKGLFITKIFHPNVSKTGEICVNTLKKDWKEDLGIKHILLTVKCLLIVPNPESALNEEAGKLLLENYNEYAKHAKLMTSIHAMPKTPSQATLSKSNSAVSVKPDTAAVPAGAEAGETKENADVNSEAAADGKKPIPAAVAAVQRADSKKVLDKKRSLKRL